MAAQPVRERLGPGGLGEGVVGSAERGDEDLCFTDLAGIGIDDRHGGAGVIDKTLLAGLVMLPHGTLLLLAPEPVALAELGVAVAAVRVLLDIFLPQQLLGHVGAFEFQVKRRPVWHLEPAGTAGICGGVEQPGELVVIQVVGQWPGQAQRCRPCQQLLDTADAELGTATDLADGQAAGQPEPEYVSNFTHCDSRCWHAPSEKAGSLPKAIKYQCVGRDSG